MWTWSIPLGTGNVNDNSHDIHRTHIAFMLTAGSLNNGFISTLSQPHISVVLILEQLDIISNGM